MNRYLPRRIQVFFQEPVLIFKAKSDGNRRFTVYDYLINQFQCHVSCQPAFFAKRQKGPQPDVFFRPCFPDGLFFGGKLRQMGFQLRFLIRITFLGIQIIMFIHQAVQIVVIQGFPQSVDPFKLFPGLLPMPVDFLFL
jgi:hypothetical protein